MEKFITTLSIVIPIYKAENYIKELLKRIDETKKKLSEVKTIIMVTHNLKLCRDADIIYLLDQGKIKEFGKYNNLIKNELFLKLLNDN